MARKFVKYIGRKAINGNSIAKYEDGDNIILVREVTQVVGGIIGDEKGEKTFTQEEYDELEIPEGVDTLAWMLDTFFGCHMLGE